MARDPKLVEVVARALGETVHGRRSPEIIRTHRYALAEAALSAIDASGHWVAPWKATAAMEAVLFDIEEHWAALRDAYLAERRGDAG